MSTPLGHAMAGVVAGSAGATPSDLTKFGAVAAAVAVLPDLDFLPGLLLGDPARFHHGVSHSLAAAVAAATLAYLFAPARHRWRWALVVGAAYLSHLLLDMISFDPSPPQGIQLFWPLEAGWVYGPVLLPRVIHSDASPFNLHNLSVLVLEVLLLGALLSTVLYARIRRAGRTGSAARGEPGDGRPSSGPLRVGVMLRGVSEVDGPGVYIRELCDALFQLDDHNEYVVLYDDRSELGRYEAFPNVRERCVWAPAKPLWDQVAVPIAAWREELDVLFHHKFTIPLVSPCPTVVQQRGVEYWTHPDWYDYWDRLHATTAIPFYCRAATRVLANSETLADDLMPYIDVPRDEIDVIYAAPDRRFTRVEDEAVLSAVREKYGLPERPFFLMVAKGYPSVHSDQDESYPRKNVRGVVQAYRTVRDRLEETPPLVVAGPGFDERTRAQHATALGDASSLYFPGYVDSEDMPALYSLAHSLVFPSYSESFGLPLVEAMACGCPVVAADTAACPEIVGEAGLLVSPTDPGEIAAAMIRLVSDASLREELRDRGLARASDFSWRESAEKLLGVLISAAREDR